MTIQQINEWGITAISEEEREARRAWRDQAVAEWWAKYPGGLADYQKSIPRDIRPGDPGYDPGRDAGEVAGQGAYANPMYYSPQIKAPWGTTLDPLADYASNPDAGLKTTHAKSYETDWGAELGKWMVYAGVAAATGGGLAAAYGAGGAGTGGMAGLETGAGTDVMMSGMLPSTYSGWAGGGADIAGLSGIGTVDTAGLASEIGGMTGGMTIPETTGLTTAQKVFLAAQAVKGGVGLYQALSADTGDDIQGVSVPEMTPEDQEWVRMQTEYMKSLGDLSADQQQWLDMLENAGKLTSEEELSFEQEQQSALNALRAEFGIESERAGGKLMASQVGRGIFESTTGETERTLQQEDFTKMLAGGEADIMAASELAKSDYGAAKRELDMAGINLRAGMNQSQIQTALEASTNLQNFYAGRGGLQASANLTNALLTQAKDRARYNQQMNIYSGISGFGSGMANYWAFS